MASGITIFIGNSEKRNLPALATTAHKRYMQETVRRHTGVPFHQVLFILDGVGRVIYSGREYPLHKGCAFYTAEGVPTEYINDGGLVSAFLTATGEGIVRLSESCGVKDFAFTDSINTERYSEEIRRMIQKYHDGCTEGLLSGICYSLFAEFFEDCKKTADSLEELKLYIERGFDKPMTLGELASVMNVSVSGLCHRFKKRYGVSVISYLLDVRLRYARELLSMTPLLTVKEVALSSGFNDVSYFCRAFRGKYGKTPEEERYADEDATLMKTLR